MAILCPFSIAMHRLLFCSLLLFLSCYASDKTVYGAEEAGNGFHTVTVSSLLPKDKCSGGGSPGLPITPRYGPCSRPDRPGPPSGEGNPGFEIDVDFSNSNFKVYGPSGKHQFDDNGNFIVEVGFGTPQQNLSLLLDSGSSITWVQCSSCVECLEGASIFDPETSATYYSGSCISFGDDKYNITYEDHSSSMGNYGCDNLTLDTHNAFPKFQFGCGTNIVGDFGEGVDGVLGLGQGSLSLLSQMAYANAFGYCLPAEDSVGSLLFGDDATSLSPTLQFTPLLNAGSSDDFYLVELLDISVANEPLNISSSKTIVDSGTVVTRLPESAYSALRDAFKELMSGYTPANTTVGDDNILDTCYDLSDLSGNDNVTLPNIALHFGGGTDLVLNRRSILWGKNTSCLCLAFAASEDGLAILGNAQQLSRTVLYDIPGERIGFGSTGCAQ